jgi:tetratricopeptide (TPR) repeat protein
MNNLAGLLKDQGKLSEAEPLLCDVLRCYRETLGDTHPNTLISMNNLAFLLNEQGKVSEAESLYRDALRCRRETLGDTHPDTLTSMNNLAWFLRTLPGCVAEAVMLAREAACGYEAVFGVAHSKTLDVLDTLAAALEADGCADEAAGVRARIAAAKTTDDEQ